MGPRALKVLSICLWSCLKRSSLQNFTKLTQPLLPVWGISSNLLTRPSTPLFLTPVLSDPFLPSNFPSTTAPAAVTQRARRGSTPQSRYLDPQVPCALIQTVTWKLLMVQTRWICRSHPELWHLLLSSLQDWFFPPPSPASYPWVGSIALIADDDLWLWRT